MIDLVYWSFLAALLPIVLHVCVRILSLVYWSFRAAPLRLREIADPWNSSPSFLRRRSPTIPFRTGPPSRSWIVGSLVTSIGLRARRSISGLSQNSHPNTSTKGEEEKKHRWQT